LGLHRHKEKIIVIFLGGLQYTTSSNWQTDVVTWVCYNILVIVFLYRRGHICSHWCYLQFDVGNVVMVTGGRNTGRVGVIKNWEKHKSIFEVIDVLLGVFCMLCLVFSYLLYRKT
uniref:KOW domain-containing protein n=1 Tax=Zea mays TaxID=4577 RepID=A0A804LNP9_MAIZE